jgi:hypothetical protein
LGEQGASLGALVKGITVKAPIFKSRSEPPHTLHEGKACDAALRRIESRLRGSRSDVAFPEKERHAAPVEMTCKIGGQLFAFEHTAIEPFPGFLKMQAEAKRRVRPLEAMVKGKLPPDECFELQMPVKGIASVRNKDIPTVHAALVEWTVQKAPTLPIASYGRYVLPIKFVRPPGVPFEVALHRTESVVPPSRFSTVLTVGNVEELRQERLLETCRKKCPKLKAWKDRGARAVLVLEDCDIQLTNPERVFQTLTGLAIDPAAIPDEVYVVGTYIETHWHVHALRIDKWNYYELSEAGQCWTEVDPTDLIDLTGPGFESAR